MARFNETVVGRYSDPTKAETINYEDAPAYSLDKELELYSLAATSMLSDKFYTTAGDDLDRLRELIKECRPGFIAKLAVYCREKMYLRSVPVVLAVELARLGKDGSLARKTIARVVQRADEISEVLGYYALVNANGNKSKPLAKLSVAIKRGLADSFSKFDEYQFGKYKGDDKAVSLRDAMFLCHPRPANKEREELYKKLAEKTLETPYTWETELSAKGNKKEVWEELVKSRKVGYMAMLRNLRNILNAGVDDDSLDSVCAFLSKEEAVLKSKQLPFRFLSAYRELLADRTKGLDRKVTESLEIAAKISAMNVRGFKRTDEVLIACDTSGSMSDKVSAKSSVSRQDVGLVLGAYLHFATRKCQVGIFGNDFATVNLPSSDILANSTRLNSLSGSVGHSTNGWKAISWAISEKLKFDKMVFFTDCQWWDSSDGYQSAAKLWYQYRQLHPDSLAYFVDLAGYGDTPIKVGKNGVWFVSGWSEKVFEAIEAIENGKSALSVIESIEL